MRVTLLGDCFPEAHPEEVLRDAKACEADGVELRTGLPIPQSVTPATSPEWRRRLRETGLMVPALATQINVGVEPLDLPAIEQAAGMARALGITVLRLIPASRDTARLQADLSGCARRLPEVHWALETTGAWAGSTRGFEACWPDSPVWLWDLAHTLGAGEDPRETIARMGLPVHVHVGHIEQAPLGRRALPATEVQSAVQALRRAGYSGALSGEWLGWPPARRIQRITASVRLLRTLSEGE